MRLALVLLVSITLCACSTLNQVQYHRIEPIIPTSAELDSKNPVFVTEGVCVMVSEGLSSMSVNMVTAGPGAFPFVLPIIPVGLPNKERRHVNFLHIRIQFYSRGQIDRKLTFDPNKVTVEYDDGTIVTPRVVGFRRGVVSSARHRNQGLFQGPEHVIHVNSYHSAPIDEITIPVPLLDWSNFDLIFPEVNVQANAIKLKIEGLTQNKKTVSMPSLLLRAVSEVRYADAGKGFGGPILMPTSSAFAPCQSQFKRPE